MVIKASFVWVYNFAPPVFFKANEIKSSNGEFDINSYLADLPPKLHTFICSQ